MIKQQLWWKLKDEKEWELIEKKQREEQKKKEEQAKEKKKKKKKGDKQLREETKEKEDKEDEIEDEIEADNEDLVGNSSQNIHLCRGGNIIIIKCFNFATSPPSPLF